MDMFCPECMGPLATTDGQTARCTIHGGEFQIMFSREPVRPDVPVVSAIGAAPATETSSAAAGDAYPVCKRHRDMPVHFFCAGCGSPLCEICAFPNPQGGKWCPDCAVAAKRNPAGSTGTPQAPPVAAGVMCSFHPAVQAVQRCTVCHTPVCATCDFAFQGGVHVCPTCASKPQSTIGPKRKKSLIISYVLAVWCTFGLAILFSGLLRHYVRTPSEVQALGGLLMLFVFVPSMVGTGLAVSTLDRHLGNPPPIWISVIWNALILASLVLLTIIGSMK
jgi:hypothetical protein